MINKLLINFALIILKILSLLSMKHIEMLGSLLGVVAFHVAKSRRQIGIINLSLCFPDMPEKEKISIIKQHFKNLSISALEYGKIFYAKPDEINQIVKLKNHEQFVKLYKKKPIILLCPHFVGLEFAALKLTIDHGGYSVYSKQKSEYVTNIIKNARQRFNKNNGGKIFSRQEGLRTIIREIKQTKLPLFYLPDQDLGLNDSIFVPFFAQKTCATITTLPKLAKLTNAVVIPLAIYRKNNYYEIEFSEAWDHYPTNNLENDVKFMNQFIEKSVLKCLPQYFWLHKRFKTQPDGRNKLYNKKDG